MSGSESDDLANITRRRARGTRKSGSQIFDVPSTAENTPLKRKRGRPPGSGRKAQSTPNGSHTDPATPTKGRGKVLFPGTAQSYSERRRQSSRLDPKHRSAYDQDVTDAQEEGSPVRDGLVRDQDAILGSQDELSDENLEKASVTPSRRSEDKRRKAKSPDPQGLPPHEQYFWQNRPGRPKPSNNTLPMPLLTHEQYHDWFTSYKDPHAEAYENLYQMHIRSFPQWDFELSQDFNVCLYGYGSKRRLVNAFAQHLHDYLSFEPRVFVINGYTQNLNMRHVIQSFAALVYDCKVGELPAGLGTQPRDIAASISSRLTTNPPNEPIYIFINSLDAVALRRPPYPALFAQLASHPKLHLLATCDTPNFPLLWDVALREQYNWLFHDTTTFQTFAGVEIPNVVDEVNELLGRSGRSIKGKGGAAFVLKSLPENARNLYRILLMEILSTPDDGRGEVGEGVDGAIESKVGAVLGGIERKTLYQKAVEEFVCSNEMGFGQLLNEFYDHDMIADRKDIEGAKILGVPWRRDECEEILEELME